MYLPPTRRPSGTAALVVLLGVGACADPSATTAPLAPRATSAQASTAPATSASLTSEVQEYMAGRNRALAATARVAVSKVEFLLAPNAAAALGDGAGTVLAADHHHRTGIRWVPRDPRRAGRTNVTYAVFEPLMAADAPTGFVTATGSVDAAAQTWNGVGCSGIRLEKRTLPAGFFPSLLLQPLGTALVPLTDVGVVGWLPSAVFTEHFPSGAQNILGVTWTYTWADANGDPTDIDHDGYDDEAYVEQWFQNGGAGHITWSNAQTTAFDSEGYDAQFVVLHELGHALGLAHFGRIVLDQKGATRATPTAVMNGGAVTSLRAPLGSDVGGICGLYAQWPTR